MRNRGERLYRKREIKRRLRQAAERKIRRWGWTNAKREALLRIAVRNEGKPNQRRYHCGSSFCDYCVDNLLHSTHLRAQMMEADRRAFENGDYAAD